MTPYEQTLKARRGEPRRSLVTGVDGFIGSNLLDTLLAADQQVIGLRRLSPGEAANLALALHGVPASAGKWFELVQGDIRSAVICRKVCQKVDVVLHQVAQVSVPAS